MLEKCIHDIQGNYYEKSLLDKAPKSRVKLESLNQFQRKYLRKKLSERGALAQSQSAAALKPCPKPFCLKPCLKPFCPALQSPRAQDRQSPERLYNAWYSPKKRQTEQNWASKTAKRQPQQYFFMYSSRDRGKHQRSSKQDRFTDYKPIKTEISEADWRHLGVHKRQANSYDHQATSQFLASLLQP